MKITRRIALPDKYEYYELTEECTLRDAPKIIATIEKDIIDVIREGQPHTLEQAKEMAEEVVEEAPEAPEPDMSLILFSEDKSSATMKKFVSKEMWAALNETMKARGFKWVTAGKDSKWKKGTT